jgi:hypothetical protein
MPVGPLEALHAWPCWNPRGRFVVLTVPGSRHPHFLALKSYATLCSMNRIMNFVILGPNFGVSLLNGSVSRN